MKILVKFSYEGRSFAILDPVYKTGNFSNASSISHLLHKTRRIQGKGKEKKEKKKGGGFGGTNESYLLTRTNYASLNITTILLFVAEVGFDIHTQVVK